jgi:transcriptional regulator GlxA family with amidase domain
MDVTPFAMSFLRTAMTLRFACINTYLTDNLDTIQSPEDLAAALDLPLHELQEIVWQGAERSVADYIAAVRVRQMQHYLRTTEVSIDAAGFLVGFHTEAEAVAAYRKAAGILPARRRRTWRTSRPPVAA